MSGTHAFIRVPDRACDLVLKFFRLWKTKRFAIFVVSLAFEKIALQSMLGNFRNALHVCVGGCVCVCVRVNECASVCVCVNV